MFYGEQEYNIDDKGRMLIPKEYRPAMGDTVVLMRGVDGQINVYPKPTFEEMRQRLAQAGDTESIRLTRRTVNAANDCEVDKQGRILVPTRLREYAALHDQVVIAGNGDRLEIWNPERYEKGFERLTSQFREKPEDFAKIGAVGLSL